MTFVDIWTTWCGPCLRELPEIQRFSDKARRASNVQVPTFSLDADPLRVASYLKEKKYTFPVIVDRDLAKKLFPEVGGIPEPRIINPEGRRSARFRSWPLGRILSEVERAATAKSN